MFEQLEQAEKKYLELERLLGTAEVASDKQQYQRLAKEFSALQETVFLYRDLKKASSELKELDAVLKEKHDKEFLELARQETLGLGQKKARLEEKLKKLLSGEDKDLDKDMIMEIRPGTGGEEAGLFASDLYRMYSQYAADKGWKVELLSGSPKESGGFKEVIFSVKGRDAYKRLKFESGVHRVQRVPTTESQGRIHTSTATVVVLMEAQELDLVIEPKDLRIDTYRSSGPGGQHMQKTDSAVRVTHIPSGIVVACQDERSQGKNKNKAMRILRARLLAAKKEDELKRKTQERRFQIGTGDRSEKIRTYNFPDRRITDHRINFTVHQLEAVLDGDLDELSDALLKAEEEKKRAIEP
jgi:peptide chain release factor 1